MDVGTVIELAVGMEDWYQGAQPGCRAIVADTRIDDDGFEVIYVRWDKEFSVYKAPQEDGWCFPGHFIDVGNTTAEQYAAQMIARSEDQDVCAECGGNHATHDDEELQTHYLASLHAATEAAAEGEAFALIWISRETQGVEHIVAPSMAWVATTTEGLALLKAHVSRVGAVCAQEFANEHVANAIRKSQ